MSGTGLPQKEYKYRKSYTMREMKLIVDYLVEHKAYGELRGRKMWMNFADTKLTDRTWQSLKETFLKRILPDIHNPYYKLTMDQVRSFRQGNDVTAKDKGRRLQVSEDSDKKDDSSTNHEPNNGKNREEKTTGEDLKCKNVSPQHRSSVDTIVLGHCYETTEELERVLESPDEKNVDEDKVASPKKSLRDCITYSEPLTPMLQEVLHDFDTDEEDETQNEIAKQSTPEKIPNEITEPLMEKPSNIKNTETSEILVNDKPIRKSPLHEKNNSLKLKKSSKVSCSKNSNDKPENDDLNKDVSNTKPQICKVSEETSASENIFVDSQENQKSKLLSDSADTVLPNNQEGLDNVHSNKKDSQEISLVDESKKKRAEDKTSSKNLLQKSNNKQSKERVVSNKKKKPPTPELDNSQNSKDMNPENKIGTKLLKINESEQQVNIIKQNVCIEDNTSNEKDEKSVPCDDDKQQQDNNDIDNSSGRSIVLGENKNYSIGRKKNTAAALNSCPKNVSLYAEHLPLNKYSNSEDDDIFEIKTKVQNNTKKGNSISIAKNKITNIHSDLGSDSSCSIIPANSNTGVHKIDKNRVLSNLFGFSSGAVTTRKRSISRRPMPNRHAQINISSDSSEWTSDSESEYVSSPRGTRNKYNKRKNLKPKSSRIFSLEKDGGLFVVDGKKIYPIVEGRKSGMNWLTYVPKYYPDEESHWRLKYVEERKKTAELKNLLHKVKEELTTKERRSSTVLPTNATRHVNQDCQTESKTDIVAEKSETNVEPKQVKIKLSKKDYEVQLEGHWADVNPVFAQALQMLYPDKAEKEVAHVAHVDLSSGKTTPIPSDQGTLEKVNKIESEIFKEIEEKHEKQIFEDSNKMDVEKEIEKVDKKENSTISSKTNENVTVPNVTNVTVRKRGRPRRESPILPSPLKKIKAAENVEDNNNKDFLAVPSTSGVLMKKNICPKESDKSDESKKGRKSKINQTKVNSNINEDTEIRYRFPSPLVPENNTDEQKASERYASTLKTFSSPPDDFSTNTMESTQGYKDSDTSITRIDFRKKKRCNSFTLFCREKNRIRRKRRLSYPLLTDDAAREINNATYSILNFNVVRSSSIITEAHNSESYQLLMSKPMKSSMQLEIISENMSNMDLLDEEKSLPDIEIEIDLDSSKSVKTSVPNSTHGNSSNVSLPVSPEISIVENITVDRTVVDSLDSFSTINGIHSNTVFNTRNGDKYMVPQSDASMALASLEKAESNKTAIDIKVNDLETLNLQKSSDKNTISESLIDKIGTVNIHESQSLPDSLHDKLKALLLESAKKITNPVQDLDINNKENSKEKKSKSKKRCSTPNKRKTLPKSKCPKIGTVVEEHMESCSQKSRKSCPPSVYDANTSACSENKTKSNLKTSEKTKSKKKKDIIKVKITKPRNKITRETKLDKTSQHNLELSQSKSDQNGSESGIFLQDINDSIEFNHNHSDTCLRANDYRESSVEFVENSASSIISITSSPIQEGNDKRNYDKNSPTVMFDVICSNACDVSNYCTSPKGLETAAEVLGDTPLASISSLITEDLSDESPIPTQNKNSKWYFFSEGESTNTLDRKQQGITTSYGANLEQIFPVMCSVPNLSTITEMSRETDQNILKRFETPDPSVNSLD